MRRGSVRERKTMINYFFKVSRTHLVVTLCIKVGLCMK